MGTEVCRVCLTYHGRCSVGSHACNKNLSKISLKLCKMPLTCVPRLFSIRHARSSAKILLKVTKLDKLTHGAVVFPTVDKKVSDQVSRLSSENHSKRFQNLRSEAVCCKQIDQHHDK